MKLNRAIAALFVLCLVAGMALAQTDRSYPEVGPGLEYIHQRMGDVPWGIHVLRINRSQADLRLATTLGQGTIFGLSRMSQQIEAFPAELGKPVAAINGDFYWIREGLYQGDPSGLQIVNGELVSHPGGVSFWIDASGRPQIGVVESRMLAYWPNDTSTPYLLNCERKDNQAVLYTPALGPSTRTAGGREIVLEQDGNNVWLPLKPETTYLSRVKEVRDQGDTALTSDTVVLSIGPELVDKVPAVKAGDVVRLYMGTSHDLKDVRTAIGGGPILVQNGKVGEWRGNQPRHPRTAIGWNDRHLYFVVVDGRQDDLSVGMTFPELANLMESWGCTDAINLDGGGSSTFWLGGKVMNIPSDGRERGLSNALVLYRTAN